MIFVSGLIANQVKTAFGIKSKGSFGLALSGFKKILRNHYILLLFLSFLHYFFRKNNIWSYSVHCTLPENEGINRREYKETGSCEVPPRVMFRLRKKN